MLDEHQSAKSITDILGDSGMVECTHVNLRLIRLRILQVLQMSAKDALG